MTTGAPTQLPDDDEPHDAGPREAHAEQGLDELLEYLRATRGFDFAGYKRGTLVRRLQRRMQMVGVDTCAGYVDFLQVHPDELSHLLDTVLINVTSFFRDPAAWDAVSEHVGRIVASRPPGSPIRAWSAGCASGEEAYSLAMILAERIGLAEFGRRAKVYATDVDEGALGEARAATYPAKAVEAVPPELVARYFTRSGSSYVFSKELRRSVIFGRHDLLHDAPISRVDVLVCRNALIYFDAETQRKVLSRLHFALSPDGILFLGKAEMLLAHGALFTPLDLKLRIFARARRPGRDRPAPPEMSRGTEGQDTERSGRALDAAFDALPVAVVTLDTLGRILRVNQRASTLFGLGPQDVGRPFQDYELSYRPTELRSIIDRVRLERRVVRVEGIERVGTDGDPAFMDLEIAPLVDRDALIGAQLSFQDSTAVRRMQAELRKANAELAASHAELQSTSEELETTNEELQSTVEELETTNEELQSTNEELETMNEELQSTNSELQALNEELGDRSEALNRVNVHLTTILGSLRSGVAVLDENLVVRSWSDVMTDLWGLRPEEVEGEPFLALEIGLPVERLGAAVRSCLTGAVPGEDLLLECVDRRGRPVRVRASVRPLLSTTATGVLLLVEEAS